MNKSIRHEALRNDPDLGRTRRKVRVPRVRPNRAAKRNAASDRPAKGRVRACLDGRVAKVRRS
jgi:hypothetical protein